MAKMAAALAGESLVTACQPARLFAGPVGVPEKTAESRGGLSFPSAWLGFLVFFVRSTMFSVLANHSFYMSKNGIQPQER